MFDLYEKKITNKVLNCKKSLSATGNRQNYIEKDKIIVENSKHASMKSKEKGQEGGRG